MRNASEWLRKFLSFIGRPIQTFIAEVHSVTFGTHENTEWKKKMCRTNHFSYRNSNVFVLYRLRCRLAVAFCLNMVLFVTEIIEIAHRTLFSLTSKLLHSILAMAAKRYAHQELNYGPQPLCVTSWFQVFAFSFSLSFSCSVWLRRAFVIYVFHLGTRFNGNFRAVNSVV